MLKPPTGPVALNETRIPELWAIRHWARRSQRRRPSKLGEDCHARCSIEATAAEGEAEFVRVMFRLRVPSF